MTDLAELGEFGLIRRIAPRFSRILPEGVTGIGDDCAVIPQGDETLLVTTDMLVEDVHFLRDKISPFDLGYKSLAVNLSDIAAMGGTPTAAFLCLALPKQVTVDWLDQFFEGFQTLAETAAAPLLGGDTTGSRQRLIINVAVLGKAQDRLIKYRSAAVAGDKICVTGRLGDSGGGLQLLINNLEQESDADGRALLQAHHSPRPHLEEGRWLAAQPAVHAMMDVSDGIDSDVRRIMEASNVGAMIYLEKLPISHQLAKTASRWGWNAVELAATGGEDYCLLCTIPADQFDQLAAGFVEKFGRPLHCIGEITTGGSLNYQRNGTPIDLRTHGWDHFKE